MERRFNEIKQGYNDFYNHILKNGRLSMWSTAKGFWNASLSDDLFKLFKSIKLDQYKNFIDLGSGDGKAVLIASLFGVNAHGIEIDDYLHKVALGMKKKFSINNASFFKKDFFRHNISNYDLVFSAPDAPMERGLQNKLLEELNGRLIVYGPHFHPTKLKKEKHFFVNDTLVGMFTK